MDKLIKGLVKLVDWFQSEILGVFGFFFYTLGGEHSKGLFWASSSIKVLMQQQQQKAVNSPWIENNKTNKQALLSIVSQSSCAQTESLKDNICLSVCLQMQKIENS